VLADKPVLFEKLLADNVSEAGKLGEALADLSSTSTRTPSECTERVDCASDTEDDDPSKLLDVLKATATQGRHRSGGSSPNSTAGGDSSQRKPRVKAYQYDMKGPAQQCVDKYLELAKASPSSLNNKWQHRASTTTSSHQQTSTTKESWNQFVPE
jgi:hypothetical protein